MYNQIHNNLKDQITPQRAYGSYPTTALIDVTSIRCRAQYLLEGHSVLKKLPVQPSPALLLIEHRARSKLALPTPAPPARAYPEHQCRGLKVYTVKARKLEHGFRRISARIPYTLP